MNEPDGKATWQTPSYEGKLEVTQPNLVAGWIRDRNNPDHIVFVDVWVDGRVVCTVAAATPRDDLRESGIGHGRYGFQAPLPEWIARDAAHNIRVSVLGGSPDIPGWLARTIPEPELEAKADTKPEAIPTVFYRQPIGPHVTPKIGPRALVGRDDWLFLSHDSNRVLHQVRGLTPATKDQLDGYRALAEQRRAAFERLGLQYLFVVAPTKELVYHDKLPDGMTVDDELFPPHQMAGVIRDAGVPVELLLPALRAARSTLGEVYYRTDTHWNQVGGLAAYRVIAAQIVDRIGGKPPSEASEFSFGAQKNFRGDLSDKPKAIFIPGRSPEFVTLADHEYSPDLFSETAPIVSNRSSSFTNIDPPHHVKISQGARKTTVHEHSRRDLPRIMVFHDSFMMNVIPFLSNNFSRSVYIWRPNIDYEAIKQERPDIVVSVMLDRFMRVVPTE